MITASTLAAALAAAKPGDRLALSGAFGDVLLHGQKVVAGLTLDLTAAEITGQWKAAGVTGLQLIGGSWRGTQPLRLDRCIDVRMTGGQFEGPGAVDGNLADGYAVYAVIGEKIVIEGIRAEGFKSGVVLSKVAGFEVTGCGLSRMRSDGIQGGEVRGGRIAGNTVHGTRRLGKEHADGIQLWSRPTSAPTADVLIEDNLLVGPIQGIGLFNVVRAGVDDGGYDRITIRRNRVVGGDPQGICITDGRDCVVMDNDISSYPGSRHRASLNLVRCLRTVRRGNRVGPGGELPAADDEVGRSDELAEAKASIASLQEINQRLAAQRDTYMASAIEGVGRLNQIAELAKVSPLT